MSLQNKESITATFEENTYEQLEKALL
jgi:hypothetical protein